MLKKMFAATTALIMIFSSFAVSYAEEAAEKQYIVRLKTSDVQLMNADGSRHFFDIADESTLDELLREDLVEWYEEDYSVELFDESEQNTEKLPEEPVPTEEHIKKYDESKWDLEMIRADFTYDINCEGQEIKIGVIDSGIADHADLKGNILEGHNYISGTYDTKDTYGHGTFVSGIIASQDDGEGIIGVVPKVRLVPLKCFDGKTTNVSVICKAIYGAVDDFGCDVINMSFGLMEDSIALKEAIDYAAGKGVIIVAAVGNDGTEELCYPAAYDNVIGVGSVDKNEGVSSVSQHNKSVFITAPGVNVKSTDYKGGYTTGSGTSYAAPFVTAAAAVMMNIDDEIDLEQIKAVLSTSAADKGAEGYDEYYGYGILNLEGCAKSLLGDTKYFISPTETDGEKISAVVYNNTGEDFSGQFIACEYNNKEMKSLNTNELSLLSGRTAEVKSGLSNYSDKYFIWRSLEDNTVVSNSRVINKEEKPEEETDRQLVLSVDLSGHTDRKYFSLAVYSPEGAIIYAVQDKMPESSVYNLSVPYDKAVENPDIENLCSISVKIQLNGQETTIPAEAHTFEEKVVSPTKTEEGYTEHTCKACGYTFRDAETEPIGYFVTYDANGGWQAPEKQNKRPAEALAISDEIPSREGYTFIGWSSDKDSESPEYEIGAEYTADEDITLYAIWRVNTYKLIYTVDGNEYKTVEASFGDRITAEKAPSKNGYTFSGWSKLPETMPANDVTVSGTFTKKSSGVGGGGGGGGSYIPSKTTPTPTVQPKENQETAQKTDEPQNTDVKPEEDYIVELFTFSDIDAEDWYYESVKFMKEKGLMNGVSETEFAPQTELTRSMFVTILHRMNGGQNTGDKINFSDVPEGEYYTAAIGWAASNKIVSGVSEAKFAPDEKITREQTAVMAYRYAIYMGYSVQMAQELTYADSEDISPFAQNAVKWASAEGILNGSDSGCFYPQKTTTRAEAAALFMRLYERMQTGGEK